MAKYNVYYKGDKTTIEAKSMFDAKRKGMAFFSVSKNHMNMLSVQSISVGSEDVHFL